MTSVAFVMRGCRQATKVCIIKCIFHETNCLLHNTRIYQYVHLKYSIYQNSVKHLTWTSVRAQSTAASVRLVIFSTFVRVCFMYSICVKSLG